MRGRRREGKKWRGRHSPGKERVRTCLQMIQKWKGARQRRQRRDSQKSYRALPQIPDKTKTRELAGPRRRSAGFGDSPDQNAGAKRFRIKRGKRSGGEGRRSRVAGREDGGGTSLRLCGTRGLGESEVKKLLVKPVQALREGRVRQWRAFL